MTRKYFNLENTQFIYSMHAISIEILYLGSFHTHAIQFLHSTSTQLNVRHNPSSLSLSEVTCSFQKLFISSFSPLVSIKFKLDWQLKYVQDYAIPRINFKTPWGVWFLYTLMTSRIITCGRINEQKMISTKTWKK